MKKISVIVPVYKVEKYLPQCIESLIKQTLEDIEIILVDDGSPDNCGKICDEYAKKDNRIIVIHKKNEGVAKARNDAIKIANGEWIAFVDSDDWVEPDIFEQVCKYGEKNKSDIVCIDYFENKENNELIKKSFEKGFSELNNEDMKILRAIPLYGIANEGVFRYKYKVNGAPWRKIYKTEMIKNNNIKFPDLKICDDMVFSLYAFNFAKRVSYINIPLYHYRILDSSIVHSYKKDRFEMDIKVCDSVNYFIDNYNSSQEIKKAFDLFLVMEFVICCKTSIFNKQNKETLKEKLRKAKKIIQTEPWQQAFKNVDTTLLNIKQKLFVLLARRKIILGIYLAMSLKK